MGEDVASEGILVMTVMTVMTVMAVMAVMTVMAVMAVMKAMTVMAVMTTMTVPLHLDTDGDLERCIGLLHRATPRGPSILSPGYEDEDEGESVHDFI